MIKWLRILIITLFAFNLQSEAQFTSVSFSVQAHQDDWQLFMSSRIIADMSDTKKMVFITLTAGDESCGACNYAAGPFFLGREIGAVNSAKFAADLTTTTAPLDLPTASTAIITTITSATHNITKYVYKNTVSYFLRLPDGDTDGSGFPNTGGQSLQKLRLGNIPSISTIGISDAPPLAPTATYTGWSDLTNTIKAIINAEKITGTQSWLHTAHDSLPYNINDHSDHINSSLAAQAAVSAANMLWVGVNGFMDYYTSALSGPLLGETDHENASALFSLETLGMSEIEYKNDFTSGSGHLGWIPIDVFLIRRNPAGNAPFAGGTEDNAEKVKPGNEDLTEIPLVISITSPAFIDKDISISISPYEPGQITTAVYDIAGNKVYDLVTTVKNRDPLTITLSRVIKAKGTYVIKNILNDKFIETRKIVVE